MHRRAWMLVIRTIRAYERQAQNDYLSPSAEALLFTFHGLSHVLLTKRVHVASPAKFAPVSWASLDR